MTIVVDPGFNTLKFHLFKHAIRETSSTDLIAVEQWVPVIIEATGPDPGVFVRGHARFMRATAIGVDHRLEPPISASPRGWSMPIKNPQRIARSAGRFLSVWLTT